MADDEPMTDWVVEVIPPEDHLYMRIHRSFTANGEFFPGVFRDHGGAMSTEWEKYSTPQDVQSRAKLPAENGVIAMRVADVISIAGLTAQHTPDLQRRVRGHSDVRGEKTPEVRLKLKRISRWVISV